MSAAAAPEPGPAGRLILLSARSAAAQAEADAAALSGGPAGGPALAGDLLYLGFTCDAIAGTAGAIDAAPGCPARASAALGSATVKCHGAAQDLAAAWHASGGPPVPDSGPAYNLAFWSEVLQHLLSEHAAGPAPPPQQPGDQPAVVLPAAAAVLRAVAVFADTADAVRGRPEDAGRRLARAARQARTGAGYLEQAWQDAGAPQAPAPLSPLALGFPATVPAPDPGRRPPAARARLARGFRPGTRPGRGQPRAGR